jgi:hypothetical protein
MAVTRRTGIAAFDMVGFALIFEKVSIHVFFFSPGKGPGERR